MPGAAPLLLALSLAPAWAGSPCGQRSASTADARFSTAEDGLAAGNAVAGAGDVDVDGLDDVLVSGGADEAEGAGAVWLATGGPSGPVLLDDRPSLADGAEGELGAALSAAGDVVGDAHPDFAIGAPGSRVGEEDAGAVLVVAGPGWSGAAIDAPAAVLLGSSSDQRFGHALSGPLDRDGDGRAELIVGAPGDGIVASDAGGVYLFEGPLPASLAASDADAVLLGASGGDQAGWAVSEGDLDGDGRDDVVVGAPGAGSGGAVYVVVGPTSGVASLDDADAVVSAIDGADLGWSVAGGGDVNGDGYEDLLAGAPGEDGGEAWLLAGPLSGDLGRGDAAAILVGSERDRAGFSAAIAGDVDGDGRADLLVGAPGAEALSREGGAAYLLLGPVAGEVPLDKADGVYGASEDGVGLGAAVAAAGDVDGDGLADLLLGGWPEEAGAEGAGAWLFLGGACDSAEDADRDGWGASEDCDDADGSVHPEAEEDPCNDRDDDCDGDEDEGEDEGCDSDDEPCEGEGCDTGDTDAPIADTDDGDTDEVVVREGCTCERRGTGGTFSVLAAIPLGLLARRRGSPHFPQGTGPRRS